MSVTSVGYQIEYILYNSDLVQRSSMSRSYTSSPPKRLLGV
jgi:hypothetical protein